MSDSKVNILYGFFCEVLRGEANGKMGALGLWGDRCRVFGELPQTLPFFAFHAYIQNPDQAQLDGKFTFSLPGQPKPDEVEFKITPEKDSAGHNLNLQFAGVVIKEYGEAKVVIEISAEPPIRKEFSLLIERPPKGAVLTT